MKYRSTCAFYGIITMQKGEVRELDIKNPNVRNLVEHGLLEVVKEKKKPKKAEKEKE